MQKISISINGRKTQALYCENSYDMARGIMFKKNFLPHVFKFPSENRFANSIHSFFCKPFHAIFLNEKFKVMDSSLVKPFSFKMSKKNCKYLIEISESQFNSLPKHFNRVKINF